MRVLIENYADVYTTEPFYFQKSIELTGCPAHLWDTNIHSAYDILDMFKPDVMVFKWNSIRANDIFEYSKNNSCPDMAINITDAPPNVVEQLRGYNKCKFLFTNAYHYQGFKHDKIWIIMPGADLFLPSQNAPNYLLDAAICSENTDNFVHNYESYHNINLALEHKNHQYDLTGNLFNLASIYNRYKQFVLLGTIKFIFSQIFFDANIRGNRVIIKNIDGTEEDIRSILQSIFSFEKEQDIATQIKQQMAKMHTCLNRTRQLLSLFENYEATKQIDLEINKL